MTAGNEGNRGERAAEDFLNRQGLRLVERNFRCRAGEIDLVMLDPNPEDTEVLAFIEVRLRGPGARVDSLDSVDVHKQRRLITAARHFLARNPQWSEHACRFDVVGIDGTDSRLRWIAGAFEADD